MEANAMTKRIVSGIFILIALGALGVILAGALTSGEQLIVRFLIAVIVAALGLYVISDLRLQADDDAAARNRTGPVPAVVPADSTAAFMARVAEADQDQDGDTFADWASELRRSDELSDPSVALVRSTAATDRSDSASEQPDSDEDTAQRADENTAQRADENTAQRADENTAQRADENTAQRADEDEVTTAVGEVGAAPSSTSETDSAVVEGAESPIPIAVPLSVGPAPATIRADQVGLTLPAPGLNGHRLSPNGLNGHSVEDDGVGHGTSTVTKLLRPGGPSGPGGDEDHTSVGAWPVFGDTDDPTGPDDLSSDTSFAYADDLEADYEWPAPAPVNDGDSQDTATDASTAQDTATDASVAQDTATASGAQETATDASIAHDTAVEGTDDEVSDDDPSAPVDLPILGGSGLSADYADRPLAPIIDLRTSPASAESNIQAAVRAGELEVIATLIEQGMLSTTGPISDRDVRTMIYVAFTSNELRKLLRAGGMPGTVIDLDLGPVELFDGPGERPALVDGDVDVPSDATALPESVQVQLG
jgi:hypothetical protein